MQLLIIAILLPVCSSFEKEAFAKGKKAIEDSGIVRVRADTVANNVDKLIIKSFYLNDSVHYSEKRLFNSIITRQDLLFVFDKKVVTLSLPVKRIYQKNHQDKKILMQQANISSICLLKGKTESLYYIQLNSGCNTCGEFFMVYSRKGELLLSSYGDARYNDASSLAKKYGVNPSLICVNKRHNIALMNF
jgi:hypothetical protein